MQFLDLFIRRHLEIDARGDPLMAHCPLCDSTAAKVTDCALVKPSQAERLILELAAFTGLRVVVHRVRLVACPDCNPGRVTRHRELIVPLEAEYGKGHLR